MNRRVKAAIILVVAGSLVGAAFLIRRHSSRPPILVTIRIAVSPREQSDFVIQQANSARFKYLAGKQAGMKPFLARKLALKVVPNSSLVEARLGALTGEEARRYVEVFVDTLQEQCGDRVRLSLAGQSIR